MKLRPFVLGLVMGALLASTVSVAANNQVQAYLTDNFRIVVDGRMLDVAGSGFHILNYNNRVYTSVRLVAEALGAEVGFEDDGGIQRALITRSMPIPTPTPRPTPIPSPTPTPTPTSTPTPASTPTPTPDRYIPYPAHRRTRDVTVNFNYLERDSNRVFTFLEVDVLNNNEFPVVLNMLNSYLEVNGTRFPVDRVENLRDWGSSLDGSSEMIGSWIAFRGDAGNQRKVTVHLEFTLIRFGMSADEALVYTMHIDFTDEDR